MVVGAINVSNNSDCFTPTIIHFKCNQTTIQMASDSPKHDSDMAIKPDHDACLCDNTVATTQHLTLVRDSRENYRRPVLLADMSLGVIIHDADQSSYDMPKVKYVKPQSPKICLSPTPKICLDHVKQHGLALKYVPDQIPEICLADIQQHHRALKYVKETQ